MHYSEDQMDVVSNSAPTGVAGPVEDGRLTGAPLLSIVIPCKNEVGYIGRLLDSLVRQTIDLTGIPIYIADAGSTDGTLELIWNFRLASGLDLHVVPGGYPSIGRNCGAAQSRSKYILFLDADIYLDEPDFIETVLHTAEALGLDAVGTLVRSEHPNWKDRLIWNSMTLMMHAYPVMKPFSAGMCVFMKREAFERLGGFDVTVILGEDIELTTRIDWRKFRVVNRHVVTTNRRFEKMGYARTMRMYTQVRFSRKYRHRDHKTYFEA